MTDRPGTDARDDIEERFEEQRESTPNASGPQGAEGGMGVSSERVGPVGPAGRVGTDGVRDTRPTPTTDPEETDAATPPEQAAGGPEDNPQGIAPKAGYSSQDPRDDDEV